MSDAGHNIVADGWAGASNPHLHPNPPPTLKHTLKVIQGSHRVSGTRCPAGSDSVKKWSESRAAAPKGRCPVGHRGEFPYVLREHILGLCSNLSWYLMRILHIFNSFSICHVIQWEFYIFFSFHQFSMLFNGKLAFFCCFFLSILLSPLMFWNAGRFITSDFFCNKNYRKSKLLGSSNTALRVSRYCKVCTHAHRTILMHSHFWIKAIKW